MDLTNAEIVNHIRGLTEADLEAAWEYWQKSREEIDKAIHENEEAMDLSASALVP